MVELSPSISLIIKWKQSTTSTKSQRLSGWIKKKELPKFFLQVTLFKYKNTNKLKVKDSPDQCGSAGHHHSKQNSAGSIPSKGIILGCRFRSPAGVCTRGNQLIFLSHIHVFPPFFLPPFPSL